MNEKQKNSALSKIANYVMWNLNGKGERVADHNTEHGDTAEKIKIRGFFHGVFLGVAILTLLVGLSTGAFGANTVTIYAKDGSSQSNRPVTIGRVFARAEIPQCPGISGLTVQADVKNRWDDGSVKFAVLTFSPTTIATTGTTPTIIPVSYSSGSSCNNETFLNKAGIVSALGAHDPTITASVAGTTVTTSLATMLADSNITFAECKMQYWLQGSQVTVAIVEDCTATSLYDFGATWNASTMATVKYPGNGGQAATTASLHPRFIVYAYANGSVKVDYIIENMWTARKQDQEFDYTFKDGSTTLLSKVGARHFTDLVCTFGSAQCTSATASFASTDVGLPITIQDGGYTFSYLIKTRTNATTIQLQSIYEGGGGSGLTADINLMNAGKRYRKTFWMGTAPGHIRIDHNFTYLTSTKLFQNYDLAVKVDPNASSSSNAPGYPDWKTLDKGDLGGSGMDSIWFLAYSNNNEGAPIQREDLLYLYNMNSATSFAADDCSTSDGGCAMAYQILTGRTADGDTSASASGDTSATTAYDVVGGAGMWNNQGNVPYHARENRSSLNNFYCGAMADKDATNAAGATTTCGSGGSGNAQGRFLSRHALTSNRYSDITAVAGGSATTGGWTVEDTSHWLDYSYPAYMLTGDFYYYEEELQAASFATSGVSPTYASGGSNYFFGLAAPIQGGVRNWGWGMQPITRAAAIAVDGSIESTYYTAMMNSNIEFMEGMLNITGTTLTPASTNATCTSYDNAAGQNRWNWARCLYYSNCNNVASTTSQDCRAASAHAISNSLYNLVPGECIGVLSPASGALTSCTASSSPTTCTATSHGLPSGYPASLWGGTGSWAALTNGPNSLNYGFWTITSTGANTFTIPLNSTGFGAWAGSGKFSNITLDYSAPTIASDFTEDWMLWGTITALGNAHELGLSTIDYVYDAARKRLLEELRDPAMNPYTVSVYTTAMKSGAGSCTTLNTTNNAAMTSWASVKSGFNGPIQGLSNFFTENGAALTGNFPCGDHGYSLSARAAASYLPGLSYSCPTSGTCSGQEAWDWIANTGYSGGGGTSPYFGNAAYVDSHTLNSSDQCQTSLKGSQIKFALAARATVTVTSCAPSPTSASIATAGTQAVTATCMYSDGSGPLSCSVSLGSSNTGIASVSGQTITGVSAGSATVTATYVADSITCSPTIAVTVTAATVKSSRTGVSTGTLK